MNLQESVWDNIYKSGKTWKKETKTLSPFLEGKSVLELGVGNGKTLQSILKQSPKYVTAIDFSEVALEKVRKSIKSRLVTFLKSDITNLPFKEEFDLVICYYVLNNLLEKERTKAIVEMKKALKPGGIILFEDFSFGDFRQKSEANKVEKNTIQRKDGLICHFFNEKEIKSLFKDFRKVSATIKISNPLRNNKSAERRIISAIIKK